MRAQLSLFFAVALSGCVTAEFVRTVGVDPPARSPDDVQMTRLTPSRPTTEIGWIRVTAPDVLGSGYDEALTKLRRSAGRHGCDAVSNIQENSQFDGQTSWVVVTGSCLLYRDGGRGAASSLPPPGGGRAVAPAEGEQWQATNPNR